MLHDKDLAHSGDPCRWCRTPHDEVAVGTCPAFEDKRRPPRAGEWFLGNRGPDLARFDFSYQSFAIFKENPYSRTTTQRTE